MVDEPKKPLELNITDQVIEPFTTDWMDTNTFVPDEEGVLRPAGTALKLGPNIIFLSPLTDSQLTEMRDSIVNAVNYELKKRSSSLID